MTDRTPLFVSIAIVVLHLLTATVLGYFRDEMYYLACADRPAFGYVDHPPLVAWITGLARAVLGDSLLAIRLLPALAAGATAWLAARIAAELGGQRYAQTLTAFTVGLAPVYVSIFGILSMNAYDILLWTAAVAVVAHLLRTGDDGPWLLFGLIAGVALMNKISMLFLGFGVGVGLLATRNWQQLSSRKLWLGGLIAGVLFSPYVIWNLVHGWPTLEFMDRAARFKNLPLSPVEFITEQVIQMNPMTLPLWLGGLVFLLVAPSMRRFRLFGWAYLAVLAVMVLTRSKAYYLGPIYPVLYAAGAVACEGLARRPRLGWLQPVAVLLVVGTGLIMAPLAKPILPVETYVTYAASLGQAPSTGERKELGRLPQFFADRFGWAELADAVGHVYDALPPADQQQACVFGQNYGHSSAIELYGRHRELPPAIGGHNNYYLWGPGSCSGEVMIVIDDDREGLEQLFEQVELGTHYTCEDCMPYESDKPIWVARGPRLDIRGHWPQVKHFD